MSDSVETKGVRKVSEKEWLNVLVVDDVADMREVLERMLGTMEVVRKVYKANNAETALYTVMERKAKEDKREAEEDEIMKERECIHLVICDVKLHGEGREGGEKKDGPAFMELITGMEHRPYIVAMSGFEVEDSDKEHADQFFMKGDGLFESLPEILEEVTSFIRRQRHEEALLLKPQIEQELSQAGEEGVEVQDSIIVEPSEEISTETQQERKSKTPWLTAPSLIYDLKDKLATVWDWDGTSGPAFTMEEFLLWWRREEEKKFNKMVAGNANKKKTFGELIGMFARLKKIQEEMEQRAPKDRIDPCTQFGGYESFIQKTGLLYAGLLEGFTYEEMVALGKQFFNTERGFGHTQMMVKMMQTLGLEFSFITGAPREVVEGIRETYGIREQCHALESEVINGCYNGEVKFNTGLPNPKTKIVELIYANGNNIFIGAGDNVDSDAALIAGGLNAMNDKDPYGIALFFAETMEAIELAKKRFGLEARSGRLAFHLRKVVSPKVIVDDTFRLIEKAYRDPKNQARIPEQIQVNIVEMARDQFGLPPYTQLSLI